MVQESEGRIGRQYEGFERSRAHPRVFEESAGETNGLQEALAIAGIGEEVEIDQRLAVRVLRVEPYRAARVRRVNRGPTMPSRLRLA